MNVHIGEVTHGKLPSRFIAFLFRYDHYANKSSIVVGEGGHAHASPDTVSLSQSEARNRSDASSDFGAFHHISIFSPCMTASPHSSCSAPCHPNLRTTNFVHAVGYLLHLDNGMAEAQGPYIGTQDQTS